jgi:hypothetical protein
LSKTRPAERIETDARIAVKNAIALIGNREFFFMVSSFGLEMIGNGP